MTGWPFFDEIHADVQAAMSGDADAVIPLNGLVVCDSCDKDWTASSESGGLVFGGYGYGPCCAERMLASIRGYGEQDHIRGFCPPGMSYADWIRQVVRGPQGDQVTVTHGLPGQIR